MSILDIKNTVVKSNDLHPFWSDVKELAQLAKGHKDLHQLIETNTDATKLYNSLIERSEEVRKLCFPHMTPSERKIMQIVFHDDLQIFKKNLLHIRQQSGSEFNELIDKVALALIQNQYFFILSEYFAMLPLDKICDLVINDGEAIFARLIESGDVISTKHLFKRTQFKIFENYEAANQNRTPRLEGGKDIEHKPLYSRLSQGKAKLVCTREGDTNHVYFTPIHPSKEKELRDEIVTIQVLKQRTNSEKYLALDVEPVDDHFGICVFKTPKALGDLDNFIRKNPLSLSQRMHLCIQIFKGMHDLHRAGYVHGDSKLENILVYPRKNGKLRIRISDFGKSRSLPHPQDAMYTGNPRFAAPEGRLHQLGEIFSTAIMAIRVLEQPFLNKNNQHMLMSPAQAHNVYVKEERQGIEKYLILSKDCPQSDSDGVSNTGYILWQRAKTSITGMTAPYKLEAAETAVHCYIRELNQALFKEARDHSEHRMMNSLIMQLITMSNSYPSNRCSFTEAITNMQHNFH